MRAAGTAAALVALLLSPAGQKIAFADVRSLERGFEVAGARIRLTIIDGAIVAMTAIATGERHSSGISLPPDIPAGLGHGGSARREARETHIPGYRWLPGPRSNPGSLLRAYRVPSPKGTFSLRKTATGAEGTWRGLTDGATEYPDDTVTLTAEVSRSGAIAIKADARSSQPGAFGTVVPFTSLSPEHHFVIPSFGGMRYGRSDLAGTITLAGGAPHLEAMALALEGDQGSVGIWSEDPTFPSIAVFLAGGRDTLSACIECIAQMPCDRTREVRGARLLVDAFAGGWMAALAPYRDWYGREFGREIAARNSAAWAGDVLAIIDQFDQSDRGLRAIARTIQPRKAMLHVWEARKPGFDRDLPDWTPREGYGEFVTRARTMGFRTMAYVNTYCVNAASPKVVADVIPGFALTRKWMGLHQWGDPPVEWTTARAGQLLYLDPLAPGWREYHAKEMAEWSRVTRTDANYEDVGSIAGDGGNGTVEALSGAEGGTAMFRLLLERNPGVPMATEHVSDNMGFGSRWPMRYPQKWGDDEQRRQWMRTQLPVCTFLFGEGARPWIPTINAESEEARILVVACSDALGGVAQMPARAGDVDAKHGVVAHMARRAQLWCARGVVPDLRPEVMGVADTCRYRDSEGRLYAYAARPSSQELREDGGVVLYQRITGATSFVSGLRISGWPAHGSDGPMGLNPGCWYVLEPDDGSRTAIEVMEVSDGAFVSTWAENETFALLEMSALPGNTIAEATFRLRSSKRAAAMIVNDATVDPPSSVGSSYRVSLPARFIIAFDRPPAATIGGGPVPGRPTGRFRAIGSGIDRGCDHVPAARMSATINDVTGQVILMRNDGGGDSEVARDQLFTVPTSDASAVVVVRSTQRTYGNGAIVRLLVNGAEVHRKDFSSGGGEPPTDGRTELSERWTVPLGAHAGRAVLLTIATDGKADDNSDQIWISMPILIADPSQRLKISEATVKPAQ